MKHLYLIIIFALSANLHIHAQIVVVGDNTPQAIPDESCASNQEAASSANVTAASIDAVVSYTDLATKPSYIIDTVRLDITHTWDEDLDITLKSFAKDLDIASDLGGSGDNYTNTRIRDGAPSISTGTAPFTGVFQAEGGSFATVFDMEPVNAFWSLAVCDDEVALSGTLNSFSISFSPTNDLCANATPIVMGTNHKGSNIGATMNNLPNALRSCSDDSSEGGVGVWYKYTGTGTDVIASTEHAYTNFDTEVLIYTGDCSNLVCLAGNDRGGDNNTSKAAFTAASGTDYYIYVDGATNTTTTGVFELSIESAVTNNKIGGAIAATFVNDIDSECTTTTSLDFSTGTTRSGLENSCDQDAVGRDQFFFYDTKTDTIIWDSKTTGFPGITIWDETGTNEIQCFSNGIDGKLFGWERGDRIIIQIYDWITDFPTEAVIDFCLRDYIPPVANDECETAILLTPHNDIGCGVATTATLYGATPSNTGSVTTSFYGERDVWFSFVATDTVHLVDISDSDIDFQLIEEDCAVHMPIETYTQSRSRVGGLTIGTTYLIRAYNDDTSPDPYDEVTFDICIGLLSPEDICSEAIALTVDEICSPQLYTFEGATRADGECNDASVWFSIVVPASGAVTITTSSPGISSDTELSVFRGDCDNLSQIIDCQNSDNANDEGHEVALVTGTSGETLYILVSDNNRYFRTYSICAEEFTGEILTPSDDCAGATLLPVGTSCEPLGPYTFEGATEGDDECSRNGVWFKVAVPTSGSLAFSTLFPGSNRDTRIKVFSGSCGSFTLLSDGCQDDDNTTFGNHEQIIITDQTPDDTLYIVVDDFGDGGTFSVCVFDADSIETLVTSDDCGDAVLLEVDATCVAKGVYSFADATNGADECDENGVWFKVGVPASGSVAFSTLTPSSNGDTEIKVYSGSCGSLTLLSEDCQDDDNTDFANHEQIFITNQTPDDTLYIVVDDRGGRGTFSVCVFDPEITTPIPADDCVDATPLSVGSACVPSYFSFEGATEGANESCGDPGVWLKTIVPPSGSFFIKTLGLAGIELSIYAGSCEALEVITECQDINNAGDYNEQFMVADRSPGEEIFILVTDDFDDELFFGICLSETDTNEDCSLSEIDINLAQIAFYQDSTYKTRGTVESGITLDEYEEFLFRAPEQIDLKLNFTVPAGVQFTAEIGPCDE